MTISVVAVTAPVVSATSSLAVDTPSGVAAGDAMLMQVMIPNARPSFALPAGWLEVPMAYTGPTPRVLILWKIAGASEPSSYTLTFPDLSDTVAAGIIAFHSDIGADIYVEAAANMYEDGSAASSFTRFWPTVEVTSAAAMLVFFSAMAFNSGSTPDATCTERWDTGSTRQYCMTRSFSGPGTTPAVSATSLVKVNYRNVTVALVEGTNVPFAGPQYMAAAQVTGTVDGSQSLTIPSSVEAGDMLLAHLSFSVDRTPTLPAGWTALSDATITGNKGLRVFWKVAEAGDIGATLTATFSSGSIVAAMGLLAWRSLNGRDLSIETAASQSNSASTTISYPAVTTAYDNAGLAYLASFASNSNDTAPFDAVNRYRVGDATAGMGINALTKLVFAAGTYSGFTSTTVGSSVSVAATIVVVELNPPCYPSASYFYDDVDISAYLNQLELQALIEDAETTNLGDTADTYKARLPSNGVSLGGDWGPQIDAILGRDALSGAIRSGEATFDDCVSSVTLTWTEAFITDWQVVTRATDKITWSAKIRHNGAPTRTTS